MPHMDYPSDNYDAERRWFPEGFSLKAILVGLLFVSIFWVIGVLTSTGVLR